MRNEETPDIAMESLDVGPTFRGEIEHLINRHSRENGSDTPDFILAEYITDCLDAYDKALQRREAWYDRKVGSWAGSSLGDRRGLGSYNDGMVKLGYRSGRSADEGVKK